MRWSPSRYWCATNEWRSRCRRSRPRFNAVPVMEDPTLRTRPAGDGCKPPSGAPVKSRGAERDGKGGQSVRQVWARKTSESEPPMTCRKFRDDIRTDVAIQRRGEPGGNLSTAQAVSGIKVARAWSGRWHGTWEPVASIASRRSCGLVEPPGGREGERQGAESPRCRVPMRGTGADRPIGAMRPGNAGGAKGAGHLGSFGGQPPSGGMSR